MTQGTAKLWVLSPSLPAPAGCHWQNNLSQGSFSSRALALPLPVVPQDFHGQITPIFSPLQLFSSIVWSHGPTGCSPSMSLALSAQVIRFLSTPGCSCPLSPRIQPCPPYQSQFNFTSSANLFLASPTRWSFIFPFIKNLSIEIIFLKPKLGHVDMEFCTFDRCEKQSGNCC